MKRRLSQKTTDVFNMSFAVIFGALCVIAGVGGMAAVAIYGELGTEYPMPVTITVLRFLAMIFCFFGVAAMFIGFGRFLMSDKCGRLARKLNGNSVIFSCIGLMLAIQLVFALCMQMNPITDIKNLDSYAKTIVTENSFDCLDSPLNNHYIIRYQNNIVLLLIYTAVYKLTYLITGTFTRVPLIILNTVAINGAVLITVLTSRRLFGGRKAMLTLMMCALFTPYYTYTPYFYTDSFSIPFVAGTAYVFVRAVQSGSHAKKLWLFLLSGALCLLGFEIKASVAILLPAMLIYLPLRFGLRRAVKAGAAVLLSFCLLFASCSIALKSASLISEESSDKYQFPAAHWVMMGLKDLGAFNFDDSDFSKSFDTKAERQQAELDEIKKRISEKGALGMVTHLIKKATWTYMDGTYYIANYLEKYQHYTPLHSLVLYEGELRFPFFAYSFGFQFSLIAFMALSAFYSRRRHERGVTTMFRIAVIGMFLFFLIWETNARYPFNFTPLYMLIATEGVFCFAARSKNKG